jgi:hypothetical protein
LKSKNGIKNRVTVVTRPVRDRKRHWVAADHKTDYQTYMPTYWLRWLTRGGTNYKYECLGPVTFEQAPIHRAKKEVEVLQEPSVEAAVKPVAPENFGRMAHGIFAAIKTKEGRFPWDDGCDDYVRDAQPLLFIS